MLTGEVGKEWWRFKVSKKAVVGAALACTEDLPVCPESEVRVGLII